MRSTDIRLLVLAVTAAASLACSTTPSPEHPRASPAQADAVSLTYLGVAGWKLESGSHALLFDPYFTRVDPDALPESAPIAPDAAAIARWAPRHADVILVSHSHYDHLMDVPAIAQATGAIVVGTEGTVRIAKAAGLPDRQTAAVRGGEALTGETLAGSPFEVRPISALHSLIGIPSAPVPPAVSLPMPARAWAEGGTLQYLVTVAGHRVLFLGTANFIEGQLAGVHPDVAVVAIGLRDKIPDYTCRLMRAIGQPPLVLPNHFDDHRAPLGDRPSLTDDVREEIGHFADEVHACSPATRVVVPGYFDPIPI
jgi:L-ascorbate metabolism protein UlaG (beta-lactamase superfamily)